MSAFDPRAAKSSWNDFLMAHLAEAGKGIGQIGQFADDYVRHATNVFGLGDRFAAGMSGLTGVGGGDLAAQQAQSASADARLPPEARFAASMTGYGPVAAQGFASKIGEAAAPWLGPLAKSTVEGVAPVAGKFGNWAGGVLGSGIEGVGAAEAGAYGRTGEGASLPEVAVGALSGVPGGVVGRGGKLAAPISADDLQAAKTAAYAPLDQMLFKSGQVNPELDAVENTIAKTDPTGLQRDMAKRSMAVVENLRNQPALTATDIQNAQQTLRGYARKYPDDERFGAQFADGLENVLQNAQPLNTKFAPGDAAAARDAGDSLSGQLKDTQRLQGWQTKAAAGGSDVGSQAQSWLSSDEGMRYAPSGTPQFDALKNLAATRTQGEYVPWWVKHFVIAPMAGTAISEGVGAATGQERSPWAHIGEDLGVGGALALGGMGYGQLSGALNKAAQKRAIEAANVALSTGQSQAPVLPGAPLRDMVRRLIYGQGGAARISRRLPRSRPGRHKATPGQTKPRRSRLNRREALSGLLSRSQRRSRSRGRRK
jgi:hypothetical protein